MDRFIPFLKFLALLIVALFAVKALSKAVVQRWPNKVTNAIDTVIQAA